MSDSNIRHLIIVPGHGIFKGTNEGQNSSDWHLESFQIEGLDHLIFIEHIKKGIEILNSDLSNSTLIFTGGQTKFRAGPISEALSYYQVAERLGLITDENQNRINLEEYARDSFENVLFSISRFHEIHQNYPQKITIIGFEFKRSRFLDHHLPTLKFFNVEYIGFDPIPPYEENSKELIEYNSDLKNSEYQFAVKLFQIDPLGIQDKLGGKRLIRNPFKRYHGYIRTNPELKEFFEETNSGTINVNELPVPW
ncbi:hypothetical protein WICMUC_002319 [Wickerhamomyces mucosus]|uniref:DUF218 domain-containing protein n=1 Tax=Wickerhamomyces mucosus TaxID=1378264 RepID=A0A9P8TDZ0_9ASCO|nr:hypothetical protein WICMUC_002319 [Wickerhamomyces mucosus]